MATEMDHKTASKYVLTIQYFVQPEKLGEFYTHLKRVLDIAHTIPGCIHSDVIESTMEAGKVTITEVWAADREEVGKMMREKMDFQEYYNAITPLMRKERIVDVSVRKPEFYSHV